MLAVTKVKMSSSETKVNMNRYNISSTKSVSRKFWKFYVVVMQNNGKEMYKQVCCTCKVVFLLIFLFTVLVVFTVSLTSHDFIFCLSKQFSQSLAALAKSIYYQNNGCVPLIVFWNRDTPKVLKQIPCTMIFGLRKRYIHWNILFQADVKILQCNECQNMWF